MWRVRRPNLSKGLNWLEEGMAAIEDSLQESEFSFDDEISHPGIGAIRVPTSGPHLDSRAGLGDGPTAALRCLGLMLRTVAGPLAGLVGASVCKGSTCKASEQTH